MDDLIARLEGLPLSGSDLNLMSSKLGVSNTRFVEYDNLKNESLDSLFANSCCVFILFELVDRTGMLRKIGHWAVLIKNLNGLVYYDPYGLSVSEDIRLTGESAWLEKLLVGQQVDVNSNRHQRFRDETNTCGRHCVIRTLFHFMSNREYNDLVIKGVQMHVDSPDTFVSLMTAFLADADQVIETFFRSRVG